MNKNLIRGKNISQNTSSFPGIDYNGGDRMDNLDNIYLGDALSLVPQGFKTVAVFPPFAQAQ